jgi:hypothetical protein
MLTPRHTAAHSGGILLQCVGFFNTLVGEEPTDFRIRMPPPATNLNGINVTLTENQRKEAVPAPIRDETSPRGMEDWLDFQPQRFMMFGLEPDTYNVVI